LVSALCSETKSRVLSLLALSSLSLLDQAIDSGVEYITGEVTDATISSVSASSTLSDELVIEDVTVSGETLTAQTIVNACGPWAGKLIEQFSSKCPVPDSIHLLPVQPRKRSIFVFHCQSLSASASASASPSSALIPPQVTPLTIDPTGVYFRPEGHGGKFICGVTPPGDDPDGQSYEDLRNCDPNLFDEVIWPVLYERVPAFGEIKVKSSWSGFYEYNTFDQNAILGKHPNLTNLILCNGFSGHGLQQSPAAGRAIAELILEKRYVSLDLSRLSFERVRLNTPVYEEGIV
jgi:FAD-dependent oxidoreductase domain-containing protein 1